MCSRIRGAGAGLRDGRLGWGLHPCVCVSAPSTLHPAHSSLPYPASLPRHPPTLPPARPCAAAAPVFAAAPPLQPSSRRASGGKRARRTRCRTATSCTGSSTSQPQPRSRGAGQAWRCLLQVVRAVVRADVANMPAAPPVLSGEPAPVLLLLLPPPCCHLSNHSCPLHLPHVHTRWPALKCKTCGASSTSPVQNCGGAGHLNLGLVCVSFLVVVRPPNQQQP